MTNFKEGQSVKINPYVYKDKWDGHEELFKKFWHHNLVVDRVIDLQDIGEGIWIVVDYLGTKAKVNPIYLWDTSYI